MTEVGEMAELNPSFEEENSEPLPSSSSSGPCGNYRVDLQAAEFGACKCGFPKEAHVDKGTNKAAEALNKLKQKNSVKIEPGELDLQGGNGSGPCKNYRVDVSAARFGDCKCGYPKDAHVFKDENNAAKALKKLRSTATAADNYRPRTGKPCNDYKVDTTAEKFGTCLCGFLKEDHVEHSENKAAELLRKLKEKNQQKNEVEDKKAQGLLVEEKQLQKEQLAIAQENAAATPNNAQSSDKTPSKGCCTIS